MSDFFDENQLKSVYYPEIEQLIRRESGASRVVNLRPCPALGRRGGAEGKNLSVLRFLQAHNDYTEWSGPNRLREILPDEAESSAYAALRGSFQVWRAINRPIQSNPLALADAKSVAPDDLMVAERRYPHRSARPIG